MAMEKVRWDERRLGLVEQQVAISPERTQQQRELATLEGEAIAPPEEVSLIDHITGGS